MCANASSRIAGLALAAAQAEWELIQTLDAETKVHGGVVEGARRLLVARGDERALSIFNQILGYEEPDLEKARELIEG